eukprot:scaffold2311_cov313-Pavlova_lutheri.AAC.3
MRTGLHGDVQARRTGFSKHGQGVGVGQVTHVHASAGVPDRTDQHANGVLLPATRTAVQPRAMRPGRSRRRDVGRVRELRVHQQRTSEPT